MSTSPATFTPSTPFIVPALTGSTSGNDFLGLRQVNLELTAACLPGINNVTRFVRPFSVLAWIHWKFSQQAEAEGRTNISSEDFRRFQEKVEILFTWGHQRKAVRNLRIPGVSFSPPEAGSGGVVELTFRAWNRDARNTSLQAPVLYGPAMKVGSGLGFLESLGRGLSAYTAQGEALARALEQRLAGCEPFKLACSLDKIRGRPADADGLFDAWHMAHASAAEAKVFRAAFFRADAVGESGALGQRSAMLEAIMTSLRSAGRGLTEDEIRRSLVWQRLPRGNAIRFTAPCGAVATRWKILQLRQTQRIALESLLQWFEHYLDDGESRLGSIHEQLEAALAGDMRSDGGRASCAAVMESFAAGFKSETDYRAKCAHGNPDDLLTLGLRLLASDELDTVPAEVAWILVGLAKWAGWIAEDGDQVADLQRGGVDRLSLWHLHESLTQAADRPLVDWLKEILERWILSQHLRVATLRSDGYARRLRFGFGDDGLEFYADRPSVPVLTGDHLAAALSLMSGCRLIEGDVVGGTYSLT